jgi:hypothetical protein
MNRKNVISLVGIAALLALLAGCSSQSPTTPASTADGGGDKTVDRYEISGQVHIGADVEPGEMRNPGGRVTIIRGHAFEVELTGDIAATGLVVENVKYNHRGNGSASGPVESEEAEVMGRTGELEGQYVGQIKDYWLDAYVVLQGRDELAGCHVRLHFEGMLDSETFDYTGQVLFDDRDWFDEEEPGTLRMSR